MLQINKIRENPDLIIEKLNRRGKNIEKDIRLILQLNEKRIQNQQKLDSILAKGNQIAQTIGILAKEKKFEKIKELKEEAAQIKLDAKSFIELSKQIEEEIKNQLISIPNIPHETVPNGIDEKNNILIETWNPSNSKMSSKNNN